MTSFWLFIFEKWRNVPSWSNMQKNFLKKINFLLAPWRSMMKIAGSGSGSISQRHGYTDPDPHQNVKDPHQNWIQLRQKVTCILRRLEWWNDGCQCRFGSLNRELLPVHAAHRPIKTHMKKQKTYLSEISSQFDTFVHIAVTLHSQMVFLRLIHR